jgi:hypothetical protein
LVGTSAAELAQPAVTVASNTITATYERRILTCLGSAAGRTSSGNAVVPSGLRRVPSLLIGLCNRQGNDSGNNRAPRGGLMDPIVLSPWTKDTE